jgi:hypothetical protein
LFVRISSRQGLIQAEIVPGFLGADNIPLLPPSQVQPISTKDPAFFPAQLNTATFAPYPANAKVQGAVVLNVRLDMNGNAAEAATLRDVPPLTASATDALKKLEFQRSNIQGKGNPVPHGCGVCVPFSDGTASLKSVSLANPCIDLYAGKPTY